MSPSPLRRVTERIVVPVYLAQHYTTFYIRERLDCGHELHVFPQGDPLTARARICPQCCLLSRTKKPARSERAPVQAKAA